MSKAVRLFILGLVAILGVLFISSNQIIEDDQEIAKNEEKRLSAQESVKPILIETLKDYFGTMEEFNKLGNLYLNEEGKYVVALKEDSIIMNELRNKIDNTSIGNEIIILETNYTTQDLIELSDKLWDYMFEHGLEKYVTSIGANVKEQKVDILTNSLPEKNIEELNRKFAGLINIEITDEVAVPQ